MLRTLIFRISSRYSRGYATAQARPAVQCFFHKGTSTAQYVVHCEETKTCAVIDPVMDYDSAACRTSRKSADEICQGLKLEWVLETHAHADHMSGSQLLKGQTNGKIGIGSNITTVQETFRGLFNDTKLRPDGSQFDRLFRDNDEFRLGNLPVRVMNTPGHTPACVTYVIGDAAFCGDTVFMPDFGTARCDFPGGSASMLWDSIQRLLALPDDTRIFVGHDYPPAGRTVQWETTVAKMKENIHIKGKTKDEFVAMRKARDSTLGMPALTMPALQVWLVLGGCAYTVKVNIRAGHLPEKESNGIAYIRLPLNAV